MQTYLGLKKYNWTCRTAAKNILKKVPFEKREEIQAAINKLGIPAEFVQKCKTIRWREDDVEYESMLVLTNLSVELLAVAKQLFSINAQDGLNLAWAKNWSVAELEAYLVRGLGEWQERCYEDRTAPSVPPALTTLANKVETVRDGLDINPSADWLGRIFQVPDGFEFMPPEAFDNLANIFVVLREISAKVQAIVDKLYAGVWSYRRRFPCEADGVMRGDYD